VQPWRPVEGCQHTELGVSADSNLQRVGSCTKVSDEAPRATQQVAAVLLHLSVKTATNQGN